MGDPGGLPSMELHRVGHDWSDLATGRKVLCKKKDEEPKYISLGGENFGGGVTEAHLGPLVQVQ